MIVCNKFLCQWKSKKKILVITTQIMHSSQITGSEKGLNFGVCGPMHDLTKGHSLIRIGANNQTIKQTEHTWRQSKADSNNFKFLVSIASRRGFRTSSASAASKVWPAFAKAVATLPLTPTVLPICSVCSAGNWTASVPFSAAPASVSIELQGKNEWKRERLFRLLKHQARIKSSISDSVAFFEKKVK